MFEGTKKIYPPLPYPRERINEFYSHHGASVEKDSYRKPQGFVVLFLFINNFSFSNERKISLESFLEFENFLSLVYLSFFREKNKKKVPKKFGNSKILLYLCIKFNPHAFSL